MRIGRGLAVVSLVLASCLATELIAQQSRLAELERAFDESELPDRPRAGAALHDLLVRLRLNGLGPRVSASRGQPYAGNKA